MYIEEDPAEYPNQLYGEGDHRWRPVRKGEARGEGEQCNHPVPHQDTGWGDWVCTRPDRHKGLHIAHMESNQVIAVWGTIPDPKPIWEIVEPE